VKSTQNDALFKRLAAWSEQTNAYSIRDFAKEVGMTAKAIRELSSQNEEWEITFSIAKSRCAFNAEDAFKDTLISGEDLEDEIVKSLYENDIFLKDDLRDKGEMIPEDEDAFDEWVTKKIADDKRRAKQLGKLKK
jgi:hypothetical protein